MDRDYRWSNNGTNGKIANIALEMHESLAFIGMLGIGIASDIRILIRAHVYVLIWLWVWLTLAWYY